MIILKKINSVIVVILSVLLIASVIASLSLLIKKKSDIKNHDLNITRSEIAKPDYKKDETVNTEILPEKKNKQKSENTGSDRTIRLNINTLSATGMDNKEAVDITKIIYSKIASSKGKDIVIYKLVDSSSKKTNRSLSGMINKREGTILVNVKVTDTERGKVVFNCTEIINKSDSMQSILEKLADKIIADGEVWNRM